MSDRLARFATRAAVGTIDEAKGIIYGVSLITKGEVSGHGVYADETALDQVRAFAAAKEPAGLKCRFDHPNACVRSMGSFVGRFHNARRDNGQTRGDLHIDESAGKSPDGDLSEYIMSLAKTDPDAFATSIVFQRDDPQLPDKSKMGEEGMPPEGDPYWLPHFRIKKLWQCDVVDEGAANDGLFGRPEYWAEQVERWAKEHPDVFDAVLDAYFVRREEGDEEMSGTDGKGKDAKLTPEVQLIVDTALAAKTTAETALATAKTKFDADVKEGEANGRKTILDRVKVRFAANEDPAFTIETIEKDDAEYQAAYTEHLKTALAKSKEALKKKGAAGADGGADGGADAVEIDDDPGEGGGTTAKFEALVAEKMKADTKLSNAQAQRAVIGENPKAHAEYVKRTNADRMDG